MPIKINKIQNSSNKEKDVLTFCNPVSEMPNFAYSEMSHAEVSLVVWNFHKQDYRFKLDLPRLWLVSVSVLFSLTMLPKLGIMYSKQLNN